MKPPFPTDCFRAARRVLLVLGLTGGLALPAGAAGDPEAEIRDELRFASGLVKLGFPDYAQKLVDTRLLLKYPQAKAQAAAVRVEILTSRGKFDDAEDLIKGMPANSMEALAMRLSIGAQYYAWGRMTDARRVYDSFFLLYSNGPPPELTRLYGESAYQYAQMLLYAGDPEGALRAYRYVLLSRPESDIERTVLTEMAELLLKLGEKATGERRQRYFKEAKEICTTVQWKGVDIQFGKTVVIMTHIELIEGRKHQVRKILNDYLPMLKQIDELLRQSDVSLKFSPMAECRYMLGVMEAEEGRALFGQEGKEAEGLERLKNAMGHLYTVAKNYAASPWAPDAGQQADAVAGFLEAKGYKVKRPRIDSSPIIEALYRDARNLSQQQDYAAAAEKYRQALNLYPTYPEYVPAVGELARCYVQLKDPPFARAVTGFIADRYAQNTNLAEAAGNALLRVAEAHEEMADTDAAAEVHNLFFNRFPGHPRAPIVIFRFGEVQLRAESYGNAIGYYRRIIDQYPKERIYVDALNRLGYCHLKLGDYTNALPWLARYADEIEPSAEQIAARIRLADANRLSGQLIPALNEYARIIKLLTGEEAAKYAPMPDDQVKNRQALEMAMFWKGFCYSRLREPADQVPLYQSKAIENFAEYVKAYPKSEMTPTALMALGTLYSLQDKPQEAEKIYAQLTREYPDSEQAKNVVFAQARSLMDVGQMEKAVKVFEKMFADASKFTPAQFLQAAQAMREARQYPQAIRALQEARKAVDRREVWEPATMALAEAYAAMADWPNTAKAIEEMLAKYPASGYTVNANFLLSRAYAEIGQQAQTGAERFQVFNSAVKAMGKARQYARQADERARADVELASIQLLMEKKNEAMASFQRILLLADYGNPKVVPYIEKALESVVPLLQEAESHADIVESCEAYLKAMPGGRLAVQGRQWRDQAKLKLAASGQPGAAPAPPAGQP